MIGQRRLGLFGGTFDPIHVGHLDTAVAARDALALDEVRLVPSQVPPHRAQKPHASPYHRFAMVAAAIQAVDRLRASDVELMAGGTSYTSATLGRFAALGWRADELFFITGADAFLEIASWKDYPGLLDCAHFVVVSRPGQDASRLPDALPALAPRMIHAGRAADTLDRSSIILIDKPTADVSSTEVRRRAAAGDPLAGLVPPEVERHIQRHSLYHA
jgi:nicotinate-nucleotide adenylyltransferase